MHVALVNPIISGHQEVLCDGLNSKLTARDVVRAPYVLTLTSQDCLIPRRRRAGQRVDCASLWFESAGTAPRPGAADDTANFVASSQPSVYHVSPQCAAAQ